MNKKILSFTVLGILALSLISAGWFSSTGNAIWAGNWCSISHKCPAGEGDCDKATDCLTEYCAQNVGLNYGRARSMDVCECKGETLWDGEKCVAGATLSEITLTDVSPILKAELISASDTSATIKLNGESKEIVESTSKVIGGYELRLISADETNMKLSATFGIGESVPITLTDENPSLNVELISASDTSATIKVNGESKEINEASSKTFGNFEVAVISADETNLKLKSVLKIVSVSSSSGGSSDAVTYQGVLEMLRDKCYVTSMRSTVGGFESPSLGTNCNQLCANGNTICIGASFEEFRIENGVRYTAYAGNSISCNSSMSLGNFNGTLTFSCMCCSP